MCIHYYSRKRQKGQGFIGKCGEDRKSGNEREYGDARASYGWSGLCRSRVFFFFESSRCSGQRPYWLLFKDTGAFSSSISFFFLLITWFLVYGFMNFFLLPLNCDCASSKVRTVFFFFFFFFGCSFCSFVLISLFFCFVLIWKSQMKGKFLVVWSVCEGMAV